MKNYGKTPAHLGEAARPQGGAAIHLRLGVRLRPMEESAMRRRLQFPRIYEQKPLQRRVDEAHPPQLRSETGLAGHWQ